MTPEFFLNNVGTAFTLGFALWSFVHPKRVAKKMGMPVSSARAVAEFRIGFGGAFIGIAAFMLWKQQDILFTALAWLWLGAAATRALCLVMDRPKLDRLFFIVLVVECIVGAMLLV